MKYDMSIETKFNELINNGVCTQEEYELVTDINGWSEETVSDILYARTGYHDFETWYDDEVAQ